MTLGEHLEELRACILRSLAAIAIACILCIWPARYVLEILARPVILALRRHGQPDSFLATSPIEAFLIYVKVVLISGLIVAAPYVIHQIWSFIAAGLYPHERQKVTRLVPISVGLFMAGVVFMYAFALVVSLNFLIGFSTWLPLPRARPTALERLLLGEHGPQTVTTRPGAEPVQVPALPDDPPQPRPGSVWFNQLERKLKFRGADGVYSVQLLRDDKRSLVTTHFKIGDYLTFVLVLTIAFGLGFQVPLVVVFLVRAGIVSIETLRRHRKIIIFGIVVITGGFTPPDLFSYLLLMGPMIGLFEVGMLFAEREAKKRRQTPSGGPTG